jgi:hypothetical protein
LFPKLTVELATKPDPVSTREETAWPRVPEVGEMLVSVGAGFLMAKAELAEVPPPGAGLLTETLMLAAAAMSAAGIVTAICVAVTEVGVNGPNDPNVTVAPATKFVPVIVSVNGPPPAVTLVGENEVTVGNGLLMVKGKVPEVPPPGAGLLTETLIVALVAMSVAGICTTICVGEIDVGTIGPNVPNVTVAPAAKPVPVIVNANAAPPAFALAGESCVIVGTGLSTVNV